MLLEGGLDWCAMSMSPEDMDFIESKRAAARDIALALGVPPMLIGIPGDTTHANYAEANRSFWRHTVLPFAARTLKALSGWLGPAYSGGLELRADLDAVEALSAERDALWSRLNAAARKAVCGWIWGQGGDVGNRHSQVQSGSTSHVCRKWHRKRPLEQR